MAKTVNELLYEAVGYFLTNMDPRMPGNLIAKRGLVYLEQFRDMLIDMESHVAEMCQDLQAIVDSCDNREKSGIIDPRDRLLRHTALGAIKKAPNFGTFCKRQPITQSEEAAQQDDAQLLADFNSDKTQDSQNLS